MRYSLVALVMAASMLGTGPARAQVTSPGAWLGSPLPDPAPLDDGARESLRDERAGAEGEAIGWGAMTIAGIVVGAGGAGLALGASIPGSFLFGSCGFSCSRPNELDVLVGIGVAGFAVGVTLLVVGAILWRGANRRAERARRLLEGEPLLELAVGPGTASLRLRY